MKGVKNIVTYIVQSGCFLLKIYSLVDVLAIDLFTLIKSLLYIPLR